MKANRPGRPDPAPWPNRLALAAGIALALGLGGAFMAGAVAVVARIGG